MSTTDFDPAAVRARLDAIETILPDLEKELIGLQQGGLSITTKSNDFDLVTQADVLSEERLARFISSQFPEDSILAEEGTELPAAASSVSFQWILDPIDGTVNYANGMPIWAISIGLRHEGAIVGAIVCGPGLGLRYRAVLGEGATRNGQPIQTNGKTQIGRGLVVTGFPYDRAKRAEPLSRALANMLHKAGGVRRLGAAALDFCFLADGRFVGYYEMGLKAWDFCAGVLIAEEAGACLTDFHGQPLDIFNSKGVVGAATPEAHAELLSASAPMLEAVELEGD
ncbi:inositol monophosphatase family protein [Coraliomargarita parva]|uniref:inositol monophosphatase family protein n=1 Tax=Coraliomargarita parva TaxID=3014050 RepID=UPI0022B47334|nr:inositol monophosphatase family protein [Coraliomargarita parva]